MHRKNVEPTYTHTHYKNICTLYIYQMEKNKSTK